MHLLPSVLCAVAMACDDGVPTPPPPPVPWPVIVGDGFRAAVDLGGGVIEVSLPSLAAPVRIPLGVAVHPDAADRRYRVDPAVEPALLPSAVMEDGRPLLDAALMHLRVDGLDAAVSVGVRALPHGLLLVYGLPRAVLAEVSTVAAAGGGVGRAWFDRTPAGRPLVIAGVSEPGGIGLACPARLALPIDGLGRGLLGLRLRGSIAVDDESPEDAAVRVRIRAGGDDLYDSGPLLRGAAPQPLDVALPETAELWLVAEPVGDGPATAVLDLLDLHFHGAGSTLPIAPRLRLRAPGIDLMVDADGRGIGAENLVALPAEPIAGLSGGAIDQNSPYAGLLRPPPLLLPFAVGEGNHLGVGLCYLPDATRFAFESGQVTLAVPPALLARVLDEDDPLRIAVVLLFADSRTQLFQRYRAALVSVGACVDVRDTGGLTLPDWWREPLIFAEAPPGQGRFARFDRFEVDKIIALAETELGLDRFTVVIDGPWSSLPGSPAPNEAFAGLRSLIADQHVRGRHILLGWDLTAAAEGSFADIARVATGGAIDATDERRYRGFASELARRCLSEQLDALGADGFVLRGLERLRDPTATVGYAMPARGTGLRELELLLRGLQEGVSVMRPDALLLAPTAAPQLMAHLGGALLPARGYSHAALLKRSDELIATTPDLPLFFGPRDLADGELLRVAARSVAGGVPSIGSQALLALDATQRRALAAILSLAGSRRLGLPQVLADGRVRLGVDERVFAESLAEDRGVVVYPSRDEAHLAVVDDAAVDLPFVPTAVLEGHGAEIELVAAGARLVGAQPGLVYRFRR